MYAALVALTNGRIGTQLGWLNPQSYLLAREAVTYAEVFRDIKDGLAGVGIGKSNRSREVYSRSQRAAFANRTHSSFTRRQAIGTCTHPASSCLCERV